MSDIPIIFSAPMVRAWLDGRKSMTRRLAWRPSKRAIGVLTDPKDREAKPTPWQRVKPGDRLWVRESFFLPDAFLEAKKFTGGSYKADETHPLSLKYTGWRPSIHMPRWVSRLTLIIEATKIERLQAISEADAIAEGVHRASPPAPVNFWTDGVSTVSSTARGAFGGLWQHLHGIDCWNDNPEVVALTCRLIKANIDAAEAQAA